MLIYCPGLENLFRVLRGAVPFWIFAGLITMQKYKQRANVFQTIFGPIRSSKIFFRLARCLEAMSSVVFPEGSIMNFMKAGNTHEFSGRSHKIVLARAHIAAVFIL